MEMKKPCHSMPILQGAALGLVLCILSCFLYGGAFAQTSSCTALVTPLKPCLPYVQSGNTTSPGADCCTPLANLFAGNATCLCDLVPFAQSTGTPLNQTRALEVATLCNQTIPTAVSNCLSSIAPSPTNNLTDGGSYASILAPPSLFFGSVFVALSLHFIVPS